MNLPAPAWMIIVCCLLTALPARAADNRTAPMLVEDAIRIGLENNYQIQIARTEAEIARIEQGKGLAEFLPVLDATSQYRYDAVNSHTSSPLAFGHEDTRSLTSALQLNWTLFDGFRMFADRQRYAHLARQGALSARDTIETTVVSIMDAYYNLVQQEQLLDVARNNRDISRTRLEREEIRQSLGGASTTDLLNARVNFNNDQSTLLDRQLAVTVATKELNIALGRDPLTAVTVNKEIVIPPLEKAFSDLLELVRNRNSTIRTARESLEVARQSERIERARFWPRLDLTGSYGYSDRSLLGDDLTVGIDRSQAQLESAVGLVMTFNLFNGNVDRINYHTARLATLNRRRELADTQNRVTGLLQETYASFRARMDKVALEAQNVITAQQNLQLQQERYATGVSDSLDFRDAQVNYANAQAKHIIARYQARIARLSLEQLIGQIALR